MQIPTNFIANSDYPYDQIVYFKEYELTCDSSNSQTVTIAHGLGFTPLCFGIWSDTDTFTASHSLVKTFTNNTDFMIWVESDDTNIYICKYDYRHAHANQKRYIKIYAFAPISWTGDCEPTATTSDYLLFNTDLGYSQLIAAGEIQPRRLDVQPAEPTPEQLGITVEVGKDGFVEVTGRAATVNLYYFDPMTPTAMAWKYDAATNRTTMDLQVVLATKAAGFALVSYPNISYNANTGIQGEHNMAVGTGTTRTGQANYNDITHFRIYV